MADIVTGNEFLRMQTDAVNRVKQMQRRADSFVASPPAGETPRQEDHPSPPHHESRPKPFDHHQNVHSMPAPAVREHHVEPMQLLGGGNNPITGILESLFGGESDKLLVLGLIWLLSKEKADQMLIMALFYILM